MTEHSMPSAADAPAPDADNEVAWAAAAAAVLRKAGRLSADEPDSAVWERLSRATVEGIAVPPMGTPAHAAELATISAVGSDPGQAPFLRGSAPVGGWDVRSILVDADPARANTSALADLAGGANSLWIRIGDGATAPADLAAVLDGVHLEMAPVVLDSAMVCGAGSANEHDDRQRNAYDDRYDAALDGARAFTAIAAHSSAPLHPASNLGADPIGWATRAALQADGSTSSSHGADPASFGAPVFWAPLRDVASMAGDLGIGAVVVDGTAVHDADAGDAGEIGYTLAAGAAYLRAFTDSGVDIDTACRLISFRYAATDDQFATIAKLRAARLAWHRITELSGATPAARAGRQHAVTSAAMLTRYNSYVNLLRTTIAAFAAGVGGAEAVTVLPFDSALGLPEEFARRMARNISALLLGESHVGAVADPAGGAYAVETFTARLASAAWAELGEIESAGGILAALADGSLLARIGTVRSTRNKRIATRQQSVTGVSEFPNADESSDSLPQRTGVPIISARRWSEPFESMRDTPPLKSVLLTMIGSPASASTRLLFIRNLLAAGGIDVIETPPDTDIAITLSDSGCRTVILAGSDAGYAAELASTAAAARSAGAQTIVLAGRPRELLDSLPDGLITSTVAAGDNALKFLESVRATLGGVQ